MNFVALIADAAARYAWVYVPAKTWDEAVGILEDHGAEVIEDHTNEYEYDDLTDEEVRKELGVCTVEELLSSKSNSEGFIPLS